MARLRSEIGDFRRTMLDVLATDATRWPTEARTLLRTRVDAQTRARASVCPSRRRRSTAARSSSSSPRSPTVYRLTQRRIWQSLGVALADQPRHRPARDAVRGPPRGPAFAGSGRRTCRTRATFSICRRSCSPRRRRSGGRIARELHDEVGQALTAIKVELAVAQRAIDGAGGARTPSTTPASIADGVLHTVRDLSHLLHPALLDDLGLAAAVEWYLKGFGKRHGVRAELLHDRMDERLAPETEAAVYRIIQEALTNVAKHAKATTLPRVPPAADEHAARHGRGRRRRASTRGDTRRRTGPAVSAWSASASAWRSSAEPSGWRAAPGKGTRLTVEAAGSRPGHVGASTTPIRRRPTPAAAALERGRSVGKLRILLGDDHTLVRQGFRKILEERPDWEVVAEASDGREAVRQALVSRARRRDSRHRHAASERDRGDAPDCRAACRPYASSS